MPHVIVKMYADRTDAEKQALADAITQVMGSVLGHTPDKVSIGLEEIEPSDWMSRVYRPDMVERRAHLLRYPGYGPLAAPATGSADFAESDIGPSADERRQA